jgi:hypothetical protein
MKKTNQSLALTIKRYSSGYLNKTPKVFFSKKLVVSLKPKSDLTNFQPQLYISSKLVSALLSSKCFNTNFYFLNPSRLYVNFYKTYKMINEFTITPILAKVAKEHFFTDLSPALKSLNTVFSLLKRNSFTNFVFKNLKKRLLKSNYFVETFFLPNYHLNSHKLLRLDSYSKYYFLKDFLLTHKTKVSSFYSDLLLNENCFEYTTPSFKNVFTLKTTTPPIK